MFLLSSIEILTGIEKDWILTCFACVTVAITSYRLFNSIYQEGYDHTPTIKNDTKLSQAMSDLAACIEENPQLFVNSHSPGTSSRMQ